MKCSWKSGQFEAHKNTRVFFHMAIRKQTDQGACFVNERQPNLKKHEDFSRWQRRKTRLLWLMWPSIKTIRRGYQRKLLPVVHSKDGRFDFWGLLCCDDRRSPWWASRDEPRHDRSRSDTVMNFSINASLAIVFIIPVGSVSFLNTKVYTLYEC